MTTGLVNREKQVQPRSLCSFPESECFSRVHLLALQAWDILRSGKEPRGSRQQKYPIFYFYEFEEDILGGYPKGKKKSTTRGRRKTMRKQLGILGGLAWKELESCGPHIVVRCCILFSPENSDKMGPWTARNPSSTQTELPQSTLSFYFENLSFPLELGMV